MLNETERPTPAAVVLDQGDKSQSRSVCFIDLGIISSFDTATGHHMQNLKQTPLQKFRPTVGHTRDAVSGVITKTKVYKSGP